MSKKLAGPPRSGRGQITATVRDGRREPSEVAVAVGEAAGLSPEEAKLLEKKLGAVRAVPASVKFVFKWNGEETVKEADDLDALLVVPEQVPPPPESRKFLSKLVGGIAPRKRKSGQPKEVGNIVELHEFIKSVMDRGQRKQRKPTRRSATSRGSSITTLLTMLCSSSWSASSRLLSAKTARLKICRCQTPSCGWLDK